MNRIALRLALVGLLGSTASPVPAVEAIRYLVPGKPPVILDEKILAAMPRTTVQAGAGDRRPARWIRQVTTIELLSASTRPPKP